MAPDVKVAGTTLGRHQLPITDPGSAPQRVKSYKQSIKAISTTGFNVNGDTKRVIAKKDLPKPPKRKDKVVF